MKSKRTACFFLILLCLATNSIAGPGDEFVQTADGIIVYPSARHSGGAKAASLQGINDKIIRIKFSPTIIFPEIKSLITVFPSASRAWKIEKKGAFVFKDGYYGLLMVSYSTDHSFITTGFAIASYLTYIH